MIGFAQLVVAGLALGSIYALIALGFVIIFKATGVFNFAQGEFMLVGAYLVFALTGEAIGLNFWVAVGLATVATGLLGVLVERGILRFMIGKPAFSVLMVTVGLGIVMRTGVAAAFGFDQRSIPDPWGAEVYQWGSFTVARINLWTIVVTLLLVLALNHFFERTRYGVAMRATAQDQEAAMAMGVSARRIFALSWAVAAALATIGGVFLAGFPRVLDPIMGFAALRALPGILLGGIDSIKGAIVGGVLVGLVEVLVAAYQPQYAPWLGRNFHLAAPYVVLLVVLWTKPEGLFGTKEVIRV